MKKITTIEELETIYKLPSGLAMTKEIDYINDHYRQFIQASPFCILSTFGDKGMDSTPRGDPFPVVRIADNKTILLPDRKGNNRVDNMRNIIVNPQVGLIFLVPDAGETIRVAGRAEIIVDAELNESFAIKGKPATSVLRISVDKIYFHCGKALIRSGLWKSETYLDRKSFPSAGEMGKAIDKSFDGETYDRNLPGRQKKNLY